MLTSTKEGLLRGLTAEFSTAWDWVDTKVAELKEVVSEWRGTAESEARANVVELEKVINALREKIVHSIDEVKSQHGEA